MVSGIKESRKFCATNVRFLEIFSQVNLLSCFSTCLDHLSFGHSNLFRISCFGFGCGHATLCSLGAL